MKYQAMPTINPFGPGYFTIIGKGLCVRFTEATKIGVLHNDLCRGIHQGNIGLIPQLPRMIDLKRILLKMYVVLVRAGYRIKPCMCFAASNRDNTFYSDIFR